MQTQKTESDFVLFPAHSSADSSSDMLALESSRNQHLSFFAQTQLPVDSAVMDPFNYPPIEHEEFHMLPRNQEPSRSLPLSYYDTPSMYVESTPNMHKPFSFPPIPSTPPSIPTSHFSEHMPTLSSASGPSIASASSSAIGSPYSGAAHGFPENWIDTSHGLGLPAAVMNDLVPNDYNQMGATVDPDSAFGSEKFPTNFVGESDRISSDVQSHSTVSASSSECVASFISPFSSSSFPVLLSPVQESGMGAVFHGLPSPTSSHMVMSASSFPSSRSSITAASPSPETSVFKSPSMARSVMATSSSVMPSPRLPLKRRSLYQSAPNSGVKKPKTSPELSTTTSLRVFRPPIHDHFQRSFFGQSSGNFVPPLESSCSFSFCSIPVSTVILFTFSHCRNTISQSAFFF